MLETPLLTIADIFIPPNSIDFSTVFSKFDLANNGVVFGVIVAIVVIYVLLSIWARKKDRRDHLKWTILPLKNADIDNMYIYIITVSTGMHPNASTTSNVFIRFNFEKRTSETFALDNGQFKGFDRGSVRAFILPVPRYPGKPQSIQLWHDSSGCGTKRSWLLNEIQMHDLQTKET
uniref:polycystin-1-like protein 3 n=1 Tax=Myxine glutinosa TaxID=7769 RepID=UPI00358E640A